MGSGGFSQAREERHHQGSGMLCKTSYDKLGKYILAILMCGNVGVSRRKGRMMRYMKHWHRDLMISLETWLRVNTRGQ